MLRCHTFVGGTDPALQLCVYSHTVPFIAASLAGLKLREGQQFGFVSDPVLSAPCRQAIDSYLLNEFIKPTICPRCPQLLRGRGGLTTQAGWLKDHGITPPTLQRIPACYPCSFLQTRETETKMRGTRKENPAQPDARRAGLH